MSSIVYLGTYGSDDPTRASILLGMVLGAVKSDAGHQVEIILVGEATYLMKDEIAAHVHGHGCPLLKDMLQQVIDHGVPIFVCQGCASPRAVSEADLEGKNAKLLDAFEVGARVAAARSVVSI
jgi:predicted peroxiredoxin